jgi:hypothetical protein
MEKAINAKEIVVSMYVIRRHQHFKATLFLEGYFYETIGRSPGLRIIIIANPSHII